LSEPSTSVHHCFASDSSLTIKKYVTQTRTGSQVTIMLTSWGVHISDGAVSTSAIGLGWLWAVGLLAWSLQRVPETVIPKLAVWSAVFFVASQVHIRLIGVTSVHLLLHGVLVVRLSWLALPAILTGLVLQLILFAHGGWTTLGLNFCLYAIPALLAAGLLRMLSGRMQSNPWARAILGAGVGFLTAAGTIGLNVIVLSVAALNSVAELAQVIALAHAPVLLLEVILTALVLMVDRSKPISVNGSQRNEVADSPTGFTSSNGTSH